MIDVKTTQTAKTNAQRQADYRAKKRLEQLKPSFVPEDIAAFVATNGWEKVRDSLELRRKVKAMSAVKRALLGL